MAYTTNEIIDAVRDALNPVTPTVSLHLHPHNATGAVVVWHGANELYTVEELPLDQVSELFDDLNAHDFNIHWSPNAVRSTCHCSSEMFEQVLIAVQAAH